MEGAPLQADKEKEEKRRALYKLLEKRMKLPSTSELGIPKSELFLALAEWNIREEALRDLEAELISARARASVSIESAIDKATEVMGDKQEAMRWLGTPVRALDFETPISLLATPDGLRQVMDVLGQMAHGVW